MGPPDGVLMGEVTVEWLYEEGADGRKGTHTVLGAPITTIKKIVSLFSLHRWDCPSSSWGTVSSAEAQPYHYQPHPEATKFGLFILFLPFLLSPPVWAAAQRTNFSFVMRYCFSETHNTTPCQIPMCLWLYQLVSAAQPSGQKTNQF